MDKKQRQVRSVPELDGSSTTRDVDSGTGKGQVFRASWLVLGYSGAGCRNRSYSGRLLLSGKGNYLRQNRSGGTWPPGPRQNASAGHQPGSHLLGVLGGRRA